MISKFPKIIICGTGTDVGKTIISSLLVQGLEAMYWKPIQSGLEGGGDTSTVCKILNLPKDRYLSEIYRFKQPVSPHWAAELDNTIINPQKLKIPNINKPLIIETAGGLMVPLTRNWLQIDQIKTWNLPIILVAKSGLGTLNHTLLSIESLHKRGISIIGLILNGPLHQDNPKTLLDFSGVPIIAQLPQFKTVSSKQLSEEWVKQKIHPRLTKLMTKHFQ